MNMDATEAFVNALIKVTDMPSQDSKSGQPRQSIDGPDTLAEMFIDVRDHLKAMISARLDKRLQTRVDASDIVQEVYLRAMQGLPTFLQSPNVHPVVWLRLIGKHLVAETHRRHFRAKRSPDREASNVDNDNDLVVNHIADSIQSVHTAIAREELVVKIRHLFTQMSDQDRDVLEMRHTEGLGLIEIAGVLGISLDAAKKRYYRALARFRDVAGEII
ncbi:MAG TPA: RNA polymerase factor sigma-70 [Planctomycetaceae bacterium]|nr:RNA polymerase factor sigma-70 [Planctomycetaceae bacterium]